MHSENDKKNSWNQTFKDPVILWIMFSFLGIIVSYIWSQADPDNYFSDILNITSWISALLAVGYVSTPSGSWHGKLAFVGTVVMVIGITFKILHLPAANALIISGLSGISVAYAFLWTRNRKRVGKHTDSE